MTRSTKSNQRKILVFFLFILVFGALAGWTTPKIWNRVVLGLDLQGGFDVLYQIVPPAGQKVDETAVKATVAALDRRINALGVAEPSIQVEGSDRIRVQLAGVFDQQQAKEMLGKPAVLEFRAPDGTVLLTGRDLKSNARYETNPQTNAPVVAVEFQDPAKFRDITEKYLGQPIAIVLDGQVISAPTVRNVIPDGRAVIEGEKTPDDAIRLANLLNAGALPYPLKELSSTAVGPTLGQAALQKTMVAAVVAVALIFLFMIVVYRIPGLVADLSLLVYLYLILLVFAGLKVTLTLPGLAALVLGVGMAVDANIITYERIRDEFRTGKSVLSSFVAGTRKSLRTILDSNITTVIAGIVMYFFGTGSIRGFAVALIVSIVISMVTAVFLSRWLLHLLVTSDWLKSPAWYGLKEGGQTP
ncbi:MAG: protein translocase subunit SecD [Alicyclobacillaceae bacterium]|nr:protein translocase subunit SecD [Alicyclobacillaceae bacterium]